MPKANTPSRAELASLATKLKDAPTVYNAAQAAMWQEIGAADGWAATGEADKSAFRARFDAAR
ncbi:hypothetical protein HLH33_17275 [Gluconacetobacter diazotrophicus]|uniref:Uncharacterized protein n=1 Tax=Gluconacetobacter diazotrophicus TaxID=33996 RepID=A0A7W4NHU2_GLUDI|nr:hypothetical protein [Gluconacetobacter diazotrophicus]MBB2158024.1 hypothetical protein [Gluconacetobacter diazotrophicus]